MRFVKKILVICTFALLAASCVIDVEDELSSSSSSSSSSSGSSSSGKTTISTAESESSGAAYSFDQAIYIDVSGKYGTAEDSITASITAASSSSDAASVLNDGDKVYYTMYNGSSNGVIRVDLSDVTKKTAVYLSGTMTSGGVKIQTSTSYETGVYLNGVSITSSNFPCLAMTKKGAVSVFLVDGTTNTLTDGRVYGTGYGEEYSTSSGTYTDEDGNTKSCTVVKSAVQNGADSKGTLYAKGDMTISGGGSLTITQGYKNCIASNSILTIEDGNFTLTSTGKSGLFGDQGVYVNGGTIGFTGTGEVSSSKNHKAHGINTDDDTYSDSFISISGGNLTFSTKYGKGITAPVVSISGGTHSITVTGPTSKVLSTSATYYTADGESTSGTVSFAPQGIDGGTVAVSGGTTTITAPWSGINSDGNIEVSGGSVDITTSASGTYDSSESDYTAPSCLKADGDIVVTGGTVTGTNSGNGGKGIKAGGKYTQSDGTVNVTATGSNLGGSSSSSTSNRPGASSSSSSSSASASAKGVKVTGAISVSGGKLYAKSSSNEAIESKSTITITGGEVFGYSTGDDAINASSTFTISGGYVCGYSNANDGLDANGNMYIKGGVVYAVCTSTPEVALDANTEGGYKLYIQGGTVITIGPIESGASLTQSCYKASSWSANTNYGLTVGSTTYVFKTPSSTSGYGSGIIVSGSSTPTLTKSATTGGTSYFDGLLYAGGTKGSTSVSLSSYSSSSSSSFGGR